MIQLHQEIAILCGPVDLLIIQGSPFCNIDCTYCYLPNRLNKSRISIQTLRKTLQNIVREKLLGEKLSIVWHSGEPLAVPISYYENLFKEINSILEGKVKINYHIQTNAILINQSWCDFFSKYNISIGVSVDGPKFVNDWNRLTRTGRSTFEKVMFGINYLKKNRIKFHAIAVISEKSLQYPQEMYDFFADLGAERLGLNIEEVEGANENSSIIRNNNIDSKIYRFYRKLLELQIESDKKLKIRELDIAKGKVLAVPFDFYEKTMFSQQTRPYQIISVDVAGNFSTFSPELLGQKDSSYNNFVLGNVHDSSFTQALETSTFKQIFSEISDGILNCKSSCQYYAFCGGGAPSNKYYENGSFSSTETSLCRYNIKIPINVIVDKLEADLGLSE